MVTCYTTCRSSSTSSLQKKLLDEESLVTAGESMSTETSSKKPGWKAMPYIIGNDTVERLATFGMQANFTVYLMTIYNMDQVSAANIINTWNALSYIVPLFGAFLADAVLGKFRTIVFASLASFTGMVVIMLTTWVPHIHPRPCSLEQQAMGECKAHTSLQLGTLIFGLIWLSIGTGGIRPCSIPFAVDQFDSTTLEGRQGTARFFNVYYTTQTLIMLFNQTLLVYLQTNVSWTLGYALPVLFMSISIIVFLCGSKVYAFVKPEGSIFSKVAQVIVAAFRKRRLHVPITHHEEAFFDPPFDRNDEIKLPLTNEFRCLNKAAVMTVSEKNMDESSSRDPWRLCSIQQVEELKCLLKIMPIWLSTIIIFFPIILAPVFPVSQAEKMNRHIFHGFQIPPASINVITMLTIGIFLPLYEKFIATKIEKITGQEGGLTLLQRISVGHLFAIMTMLVAGLVERRRRSASLDGAATMSVFWLAPQFICTGFIHVFADVGHIALFNRESPVAMRSIGNSLLYLNQSVASNLREDWSISISSLQGL
ncbi:hypothetical protein PIB30_006783 [Stylosanthes scabra]|uniref:Uncharacterized protein n=1 Tax=Stylosanthes scabra TaxID=79078 RepID=A0ABU6U370_9FABA|nr:hypothetical protein [Stylosanthes scabra]